MITVTGCSVSMESIPVPDGVTGDTYEVNIEFSNVLNIPGGAKVLSNGSQVGRLERVKLDNRSATATVAILKTVQLPVSTRAELRQTTLLGDLYIALSEAGNRNGTMLADGSTIPMSQTSPPDNVETVFISMGQLINGGAITKLQQTMRETNAALPKDPQELTRIVSNATKQIVDLGRSTAVMNGLLSDGAAILQDLTDRIKVIDRGLTQGPERFKKLQELFLVIVELISDLRFLTKPGGALLTPPTYRDLKAVVSALDPMVATLAEIDRSVVSNGDLISKLIAKKIAPFLSGPAEVNVVKVGEKNGKAVALADFLRAIGMV
ncbi:MlaD family protein [Tsukamurella sp. DT100]|uniref:MlaD family protein n=1 Tax=Tsukamurella sp. DT100 TaxID=3393415 RepID=UPI003CF06BA1